MTPEKFACAYATSFEPTRCFLLSRGLTPYRAEELAQAAWSRAWERRGQLRNLASFAAWVNTIALNMLRGEARKAGLFVALEDRDEPARPVVEQHLDAETVLAALSEEDRRLMLLHIVAGLTSKEISSTIRLSPVAVRVRLHRAKQELRKAFPGSAQSAPKSRRRDRQLGRNPGP